LRRTLPPQPLPIPAAVVAEGGEVSAKGNRTPALRRQLRRRVHQAQYQLPPQLKIGQRS